MVEHSNNSNARLFLSDRFTQGSIKRAATSAFIVSHLPNCKTTVLRSEFISHLPPMGKAIAVERSEARLLCPQSPPHHRKKTNIKGHRKHSSRNWGRMWGPCKGRSQDRSPGVANQAGKNLKSYDPTTRREKT